jgi:hypothetical protein
MTFSVSSPNRRARAIDEAAASAANATQVLFTSFSREPAPTGPTQMVRWPSASKRGVTRGRTCSKERRDLETQLSCGSRRSS